MKFAFLSGLTIWVGFLAFSQHGLAEQSTLTSADRELTIQGSLLCYGACLPDPKPDDHLMALYAIDGTPDIRATGSRLADDFYPDKGLDAASAAKLNLHDTPGYWIGPEQEWKGILRHGAKMLYAYIDASVPKISVIVRKSYAGAYLGMCCKDTGADFMFAWPQAKVTIVGADTAASVIFAKEIKSSP